MPFGWQEAAVGFAPVNPEPWRKQCWRAGGTRTMGTEFSLLVEALISQWADVQKGENLYIPVEKQEFEG